MQCAFATLLLAGASVALASDSRLPGGELDLELAAPIGTWDEAIPLGNGLLGGLLWGSGGTLRLSLDRGDLWDLRSPDVVQQPDWTWATLKRLVAEGKQDQVVEMFDRPYDAYPYPTKVPAGRVEIDLADGQTVQSFSLHLATAEGRARLSSGATVSCFYSAERPVALMWIPGPEPTAVRIVGPASVGVLGYPQAQSGEADGARWYIQQAAEGLTYVGLAATRRLSNGTLLAVTVTSTSDGPDPLAVARERTREALDEGYEACLVPHEQWWAGFWAQSRVEIPDPAILRHYYLVEYFYGSASRLGHPPIPLQGVWTADAGSLPPWKGDYHNDLNTQTTYIAYLAAGHTDEGRCFLEFLWSLRPAFRRFAREFYGVPGIAVPGVMGFDGKPLGGWSQYCVTPTNQGWLAWLFYEHWRYTADRAFLRDRAYPWCAEVGDGLLAMLEPGADGKLKLPLSSSPEIFNNSLEAWLRPNSNYDQACLKALFMALADMAASLDRAAESAKWRKAADDLGGFLTEPNDGCLMFSEGHEVRESHRHLSHSMAIHPYGFINTDGSEADRAIIDATCRRYDELGTSAWCGYSFSWMSCLRARVGDAEAALHNLELFVRAFVLRNGFHANGDQTASGLSNFTYRPFTLEGNFLAAQAVHEMLLQSWAPIVGSGEPGTIRLFPATPREWASASFDDLRAEGGHRVSAVRENGTTTWFRIVTGSDGVVRIRDSFGGRKPIWSRQGVRRVGPDYVVDLRRGEELSARLPKPAPRA